MRYLNLLYSIHVLSCSVNLIYIIYRVYCIFFHIAFTNHIYWAWVHALVYSTAYNPTVLNDIQGGHKVSLKFILQNTIIGMRHILGTYTSSSRISILFIAMFLEDEIKNTFRYNSYSMSYPNISGSDIRKTKKFYAVCQFHATAFVAIGNTNLCFYPLLPIQLSLLLVTLVRNSIISSYTYHLLYSISLLLSYPLVFMNIQPSYVFTGYFAYKLRIHTKMNKYLIWIIVIAFNEIKWTHWVFDYTYLCVIYGFCYHLYRLKWLITYKNKN
jgi:hypothetical protein